MLESMTGFGQGTARAGRYDVRVEVRSVNGRHTEVTVRAPRALDPYETALQRRVREVLERGKVTVHVQAAPAAGEARTGLRLDLAAAEAHAELLERLRTVTRLKPPLGLEHLLLFRDAFLLPEDEAALEPERLWSATQEALEAALAACRAMRRREGAALAEDLAARLAALEAELTEVEAAAPARLDARRETLRARVTELLGEAAARANAERLELEIVLLADKLDVTEECVRLRAHLAQFREALAASGMVGRRLGFLTQELHRELNTLAAKAQDATLAHRAVTMKEELEKIREQVQNVA